MSHLNARETAFLIQKLNEVETSERSSPTEQKEAERIRAKLEDDLIE